MQTKLAEFIKDTPQGREADAILRSCVHCGFCNATCPTYQLLGDELDGPRGRIYLIKQLLEGHPVTRNTQLHLDRCLTCLNCETTCPSGVRYGKLLDLGRHLVETRTRRSFFQRLQRAALLNILPYESRFRLLLGLGKIVRSLLPGNLRKIIPEVPPKQPWSASRHPRKVLILDGCAQPVLAPQINAATAWVLDHLGISIVKTPAAGCCGALAQHLSAPETALRFIKRNIDAWWPHIEAGAGAIVMTASGCGVFVKQYADLLEHDPDYRDKAKRVTELSGDISTIVSGQQLPSTQQTRKRIAFHSPCTLQHGQKINGVVEALLVRAGFELVPVKDAHLCCGSAGTYSLLQPQLSQQLLDNKLDNLQQQQPELIATANIGCLAHLQSKAKVPVVHWIELFTPKSLNAK